MLSSFDVNTRSTIIQRSILSPIFKRVIIRLRKEDYIKVENARCVMHSDYEFPQLTVFIYTEDSFRI